MFTFGILLYNQEDLIVETLESIRYQIETYGKNEQIRLLIVDDFSTDRSLDVVEVWTDKFSHLFSEIRIIKKDANQGIVSSFLKAIEFVEDEPFKLLAGDDVFSSINIFEHVKSVADGALDTYFAIYFDGTNVYYDTDELNLYWRNMDISPQKFINTSRVRGVLRAPSTVYRKKTFDNADCQSYTSQFTMMDDTPTWYMIMKHIRPENLHFYQSSIVLYRIHNRSISQNGFKGVRKEQFFILQKDRQRLYQTYCNETKGIEKIYWKIKLYRETKSIPKYLDITQYIDYFIWQYRLHHKKTSEYEHFKEQVEKNVYIQQRYYDEIKKRARKFYSEIGADDNHEHTAVLS